MFSRNIRVFTAGSFGKGGILNLFFTEVRGAASNSAYYYGYPELWILRYPAHRYHAVPTPSCGF
jgi:hypothetical protein